MLETGIQSGWQGTTLIFQTETRLPSIWELFQCVRQGRDQSAIEGISVSLIAVVFDDKKLSIQIQTRQFARRPIKKASVISCSSSEKGHMINISLLTP